MLKPVTRIAAACALIFGSSSQAATLQEVLRHSFGNDPELLEAKANVDVAHTDIEIAKSGHLPIVSLTASQVLAQKHRYESNERPRGINPGLQGRLNLYSFGGVDARVRYSEHKHDYFHHKFYETQETVGQTIGKLYLSALRAKENIMAAQSNLQRHHQIINDLQIITKYDKGRQSELDQAMARRLRVQAYLAEQARSMELYLSRLGKYTQKRLNPVSLSDPFSGENASSIVKRYQAFDLGQQPSYQAQQAERASVLAELDVNKSARYPAIDLIASASRDNKEIYLNFNWDFFSPNANYQVDKSAQTLVAAEAKSDQILRDVVERSRSAEVDMRQSLNRVGIAQQQIAAQKKVIKAYELQFKIARRTLIDVLDSYSDLWNIESEVVAAQNDFRDAALEYLSSQSAIARFAGVEQNRDAPERTVRRRFRDHLPETFLPKDLQERFDKIDFDAVGEEFAHLGDQLNYLKDKTKEKLDKILPDETGAENASNALSNTTTSDAGNVAGEYPVIVDENTLSDSNRSYVPKQKQISQSKSLAKNTKNTKKPKNQAASSSVAQPKAVVAGVGGLSHVNTSRLLNDVKARYGENVVDAMPTNYTATAAPRPAMHAAQQMPDAVLTYDEIMKGAPVSLPNANLTVSGSLKKGESAQTVLNYDDIMQQPVAEKAPTQTDKTKVKEAKATKKEAKKALADKATAKSAAKPAVSGSLNQVSETPVTEKIAEKTEEKVETVEKTTNTNPPAAQLPESTTALTYDDIMNSAAPALPEQPKVTKKVAKKANNRVAEKNTSKTMAKPMPVLTPRSQDKVSSRATTSKDMGKQTKASAHTELAAPTKKAKKADLTPSITKKSTPEKTTTTPKTLPESAAPKVKLVESPEHGVILDKPTGKSWKARASEKNNKTTHNHFENMLQEQKSPVKSGGALPDGLQFDARVPYE